MFSERRIYRQLLHIDKESEAFTIDKAPSKESASAFAGGCLPKSRNGDISLLPQMGHLLGFTISNLLDV